MSQDLDLKIDEILANADALEKINKRAKERAHKELLASYSLGIEGYQIGIINAIKVNEPTNHQYAYRLLFLFKVNGVEKEMEVYMDRNPLTHLRSNIEEYFKEKIKNMLWDAFVSQSRSYRV